MPRVFVKDLLDLLKKWILSTKPNDVLYLHCGTNLSVFIKQSKINV
jgi:hypothetical protein